MNLIETSYGWIDLTTGIEYATLEEYYESKGGSNENLQRN